MLAGKYVSQLRTQKKEKWLQYGSTDKIVIFSDVLGPGFYLLSGFYKSYSNLYNTHNKICNICIISIIMIFQFSYYYQCLFST
jgi:hypothetical protein